MSLRDKAQKDCIICNGSGQDTRTTGFTAVCECVSEMKQSKELPKEIQDRINDEADKYGFVVPYDGSNKFYNDDKVKGYQDGATAWAKIAIGFAEWKDAKGYRRERGRKNKERIYGEWYIPAAGYGGGQPITYTSEQLLLEYLKTLPQ